MPGWDWAPKEKPTSRAEIQTLLEKAWPCLPVWLSSHCASVQAELSASFSSGTCLNEKHREVSHWKYFAANCLLRSGKSSWPLNIQVNVHGQMMLKKLWAPNLLGIEEVMSVLQGLALAASCMCCRSLQRQHPGTRKLHPSSSEMSLSRPLLTELNMMPAGKGKSIKGTISIFTEQTKRINLEQI